MTASWTAAEFAKYIKAQGQYPEGFDVALYLQRLMYRYGILPIDFIVPQRYQILDLFCGKGRLCHAVPLRHCGLYTGVDINAAAIEQAREEFQDYRFEQLDATIHKWQAHCIILWTAVSMLDDDTVLPFLRSLDAGYIIIGEICGREWRFAPANNTHPAIYNRDWEEYPELMRKAGYKLSHHEEQPHAHYSSGAWPGRDTMMHTFVFTQDRGKEWGVYREALRRG